MSQQVYVGIDLGGTSVKYALINTDGQIVYKSDAPTAKDAGGEGIIDQIDDLITSALSEMDYDRSQVHGVGIGVPGFVNVEEGYVYEAVNLGFKDFAFKAELEGKTGLAVFLDNDANTAALGEMWRGSGEGTKDLLCITLGTGVGGGVILNGNIYHGHRGVAGEIGHYTIVTEGGAPCNCGKSGCIETIASATGIVRLAKEHLGDYPDSKLQGKSNIEAKDVAQAAEDGDALARHVIKQAAEALGVMLGNYAVILNPEKIVIGGGVSKAGEVLFNPIREAYQKYGLPHLTGHIDIAPATLGNDAGVIGAGWLVHHNTNKIGL
ncbi:ROK family glucokinase [Caldalkalibacillus salinus]|uniref:ROK family glucokinase n=1 Tax=Caldalkalibacillus salinus TaxID=2803787 RepID=UPI001920949A|nr:ROK family glucokinase [Caldalkalibacillus salinus]